jgi:hypothetical protein
MRLWIDCLGWGGVALLLAAYALVSAKKVAGDAVLFQGMNMLGGALVLINSLYYHAYPSVGVNLVWIVIAVWTLARRRRIQSSA